MTILDILFFNFWNSTKSISSEAITPLKTISDDSIWHPKGHPSIPGKSQNLQFFGFWPCLVLMDSICMLWRHVCAVETWYMLYGHGTCLLVGEEHVLLLEKSTWCLLVGEEYMVSSSWRRIYVVLLEKNIWLWKMSSCWRRIYGYGRCLLVGEEYMSMEDVFLFLFLFSLLFLFSFLFLFVSLSYYFFFCFSCFLFLFLSCYCSCVVAVA